MAKLGSLQDNDKASFVLDTNKSIARLVTDNGAPGKKIALFEVDFEDSVGSSDLLVNGSVTPVVFTVAPPVGEIWFIQTVTWLFDDSGTTNLTDFGAINGGLTNGVLLEERIDSVNHVGANLINNIDIIMIFPLIFSGASGGVGNSTQLYVGRLGPTTALTLNGDDGDLIRITVRDNVTGLNAFRMGATYMRIL